MYSSSVSFCGLGKGSPNDYSGLFAFKYLFRFFYSQLALFNSFDNYNKILFFSVQYIFLKILTQ